MKQTVLLLLVTIFTLGCEYQKGPKDLGEDPFSDQKVELNESPALEVEAEEEEEVTSIDENGEEVILRRISTLKELDLFSLLDIFFSNFIVPINKENEAFDTRVDYENLHILNSTGNRLYAHLVNSIEKKMNEIDLTNESDNFKIAFYINAYNYSAIRVINKNYLKSNGSRIKSIRTLSGSRIKKYKIFSRKFINISGKKVSLDYIEKTQIKSLMTDRTGRIDARFHFAVICASGGCPVTLDRAYREETLDQDLTFITTQGLQIPRILKKERNRLYLSKIISDWYKSDFISDSGSVQMFLSNYGVNDTSGKIKKLDYDWNLNILTAPRETPTLPELETVEFTEVPR